MKIIQFGLHYSPNVGDGIIAECLVHGLGALHPGACVRTIDISGRKGFDQAVVGNRELALKALSLMPKPWRGRVVEARLKPILDRATPAWRAAAAEADLAVIGGGQIFSDADLNFCTKVARVATILAETRTPTAIFAAGVAHNWSPRGRALFSKLFDTDLRQVGLRDAGSIDAWTAQTGGTPPASVLTRDPGLLAAECYGPPEAPGSAIGLCVMGMDTARYHADGAVAGGPGLFADLARQLAGRGHDVLLFCNGAAEDRTALAEAASAAGTGGGTGGGKGGGKGGGGRIRQAPAPRTPAELAGIIRSCRAVVAHRLHACIVAYSYGLPVVGLGWDRKLESFFRSVGAEAGFTDAPGITPADVVAMTEAALEAGIDPGRHARVLAEARSAIAGLAGLIPEASAAASRAGG